MNAKIRKTMKDRIARDLMSILVRNGRYLDSCPENDHTIPSVQAAQKEIIQWLQSSK